MCQQRAEYLVPCSKQSQFPDLWPAALRCTHTHVARLEFPRETGLILRCAASSLVEAGTSGFLSISDSNCRVPEELGQESKASSCLYRSTPLLKNLSLHGFPKQPSVPWKSKGQNTELWPAGPALLLALCKPVGP